MISLRKTQINEVAQNLFNSKGYSATSMRDLAREVGIEAASLYNHYRSKEEILQKICFDMAEQFFGAIDKIPVTGLSSADALQKAISEHINVIVSNLNASRVFFTEWKHLNEKALEEFMAMRKLYEGIFIDILRKGIENEEFRNINIKITVFTILSSLNAVYDLYKPFGKLKANEIAENICDIIIPGILNTKN